MGFFDRFRKSDAGEPVPGNLVRLDKKILLCAIRVGSQPSPTEIQLMLQQCKDREIRHLREANVRALGAMEVVEFATQSLGNSSQMQPEQLVLAGCGVVIGKSLSEAKEGFPADLAFTPKLLWHSGSGNIELDGELFLIGAVWTKRRQ